MGGVKGQLNKRVILSRVLLGNELPFFVERLYEEKFVWDSDHTVPSHTAPISNSLPTIKTLYTYTPIAFTPHSSTLHNTTRYTYLLLQDRQP